MPRLVVSISELNPSTDKKMFLVSSGNEKQKYVLKCVCVLPGEQVGDNGAIVVVYTHGFLPSYFTLTTLEKLKILYIIISFRVLYHCLHEKQRITYCRALGAGGSHLVL